VIGAGRDVGTKPAANTLAVDAVDDVDDVAFDAVAFDARLA
jgi:hypothetical protein